MATTKTITIMRTDFRNPGERINFFEDILDSLDIPKEQWDDIQSVDITSICESDIEITEN